MNEKNNNSSNETKPRNKLSFLAKIIIILILAFFAFTVFKYWQINSEKEKNARTETQKFNNVESEIFDLSDNYKNQEGNFEQENSDNLVISELREKDSEFIYQLLLKNQMQINDLREENQKLQKEFIKYKNHGQVAKIILAYVDLRQKIFSRKTFSNFTYQEALKNFDLLSTFDDHLQEKISKMKPLIAQFQSQENLEESFEKLIPELISQKNYHPDAGFLAKIRHNLSSLVIIRRIDGKNTNKIDEIINKTENCLHQQNFQEALNFLLQLDPSYHKILANFLLALSNAAETQKIDQEIINYLQNIS